MKILHVASGDLWGGAEAILLSLVRAQRKIAGVEVACALMNEHQLSRELLACGVPTFVFDERVQGFVSLVRSVRHSIHDFQADIVHAHRGKENMIAALCRLLNGRDQRYLTTVHGMPEPAPGNSPIRRWALAMLNSMVLRHGMHAVVAVSHDIARHLREDLNLRKVHVVHNGVQVSPLDSRTILASGATHAPVTLLSMGRLVQIKRYERLSQVAAEIMSQSGRAPKILLAGEGPLAQDLVRHFADSPGGQFVEMLGFVRDTAALLQHADGLVITSDHEGIPMVALEALAANKPVFAFEVGGMPEIAAQSPAMRLSPVGDIPALVKNITDWFSANDHSGSDLPHNWPFDIHRCAQAYIALYRDLLSA